MAYESDHTQFMRTWMEQHPEERDVQRTGRALWWDKPQTNEFTKASAEAKVSQKPYPYDNNF